MNLSDLKKLAIALFCSYVVVYPLLVYHNTIFRSVVESNLAVILFIILVPVISFVFVVLHRVLRLGQIIDDKLLTKLTVKDLPVLIYDIITVILISAATIFLLVLAINEENGSIVYVGSSLLLSTGPEIFFGDHYNRKIREILNPKFDILSN